MENPLREFKEKNIDMDWLSISKKSGLSIQTLMSILKKDENTIGGVTIATYVKILNNLDIDLSKYYKQKVC